jgi:hypothetical protein
VGLEISPFGWRLRAQRIGGGLIGVLVVFCHT